MPMSFSVRLMVPISTSARSPSSVTAHPRARLAIFRRPESPTMLDGMLPLRSGIGLIILELS